MTSHRHQLIDTKSVIEYIRAGKGKFTLVSKSTGTRFTYKVSVPNENRNTAINPIFIRVLTGPDTFKFIGTLFPKGYAHSRKSSISDTAKSVTAFRWFIANIDKALDKCEFWHEGSCGKCGRALTVPESIMSGFGPICAGKV